MRYFIIFHTSNRVDFFILLSSIPSFLKPGIRPQAGFLRSNGSFAGGFVVFLDASNDFNARHVGHIDNIRSNRRCGIFQDCERFGKPFFCAAVNCPQGGVPLTRRCVADSGFFLFWRRAFGQPRHRRRIRHGGRCEPERGRAGDRRQPQPYRIDAAGAAGSWRRIVLSGIPKALNRSTPNVPKNKALRDRAFRKYCGEHHISPKKNISAKQNISAT